MTKSEFYSAWLSHFAKGVSKQNMEKYVISTGNFLWHVFSWELLDKKVFLSGDSAKQAYDQIDKRNALCIDWFEDDETKKLTPKLGTAKALEEMKEIYVIASDFSWTYIKTHESECGPYFMKL